MTGATVSDTNDSAGTDPDNDDLLTVIDDKRFLFHGGGAEKFKQALAEFKRQRGRPAAVRKPEDVGDDASGC